MLGRLAQEEQQAIEQRLLTEDDFFEEVEVTEDELFDEYVADELTPVDRKQFERYFLSTPERRRDLKFAAGLRQYVAKKTVPDYAAELSASLAGGSGVRRTRIAWPGQSQLFRIALLTAFIVIAGVLLISRLDHPPTSYATLTLTINNNNRADSGPATEVNLPLGADAVRLFLKLPEGLDQETRFRVELLKDSGETISIEKVARVEQAAVIEIPAAQLSRGQYALKLYVVKFDGTEQRVNGSYFLSVK